METIDQLRLHLRNTGYSEFLTSDQATCVAIYDLRLEKDRSGWRVYETERGQVIATYAETPYEREATTIFLRIVSARIYHLGTYAGVESVAKVEAALRAAEVPFQRNDIPHEGKLRVFVAGSDLQKAQHTAALSGV